MTVKYEFKKINNVEIWEILSDYFSIYMFFIFSNIMVYWL